MKKHLLVCDIAAAVCGVWAIGSIIAVTVSCDSFQQIGYNTSFCSSMVRTRPRIADTQTRLMCIDCPLDSGCRHRRRDRDRYLYPSDRGGDATADAAPPQDLCNMVLCAQASVRIQWSSHGADSADFDSIIILIGLHVGAIQNTVDSDTPGVALSTPTVYQQVQVVAAIVTSALPALHRWLRKFSTSMGGTWMQTSMTHGYTGGSGDNPRSKKDIPLTSLNRSQISGNGGDTRNEEHEDEVHHMKQPVTFRPDQAYNNTSAYRSHSRSNDTDGRSGSQESVNSEARIIRKDVDWHVRYEAMADGLGADGHPMAISTGTDHTDGQKV